MGRGVGDVALGGGGSLRGCPQVGGGREAVQENFLEEASD